MEKDNTVENDDTMENGDTMEKDKTIKKESECTLEFFILLEHRGQKDVLNWCMNSGLIASSYNCTKCSKNMKLAERKKSIDGFEWRCRGYKGNVNSHDVSRSVRKGSFFYNSHLSMCVILRLTRFWFGRCLNEFVVNELKVHKQIVSDWFLLCREICMIDVINNSTIIGGEEVTLELNEYEFSEINFVKGKVMRGNWVYAGIEKETGKYFFKVVLGNTKENLLSVIRECVLPGSIVISNCWEVYDCNAEEQFINLRIAHNLTFKEHKTNVQTNSFDAISLGAKRFCRNKYYYSKGVFDSYLGEYIWRKLHGNSLSDDVFKLFLRAISLIYKPVGTDVFD